MYFIVIQTTNRYDAPTCISCGKEIHPILSLLESHPKVRAYKIIFEGGLMLTENLRYAFPGYATPAGKAVENFDWEF